jgi:hypothetical protein
MSFELSGTGKHEAQLKILMKWREFKIFFRNKERCSVGISASLVALHCIISQMLWSQPCDGDTEASKNVIYNKFNSQTDRGRTRSPNVSTLI